MRTWLLMLHSTPCPSWDVTVLHGGGKQENTCSSSDCQHTNEKFQTVLCIYALKLFELSAWVCTDCLGAYSVQHSSHLFAATHHRRVCCAMQCNAMA